MMFSCIFHRSSQCRLVLMASSFVSLLMVSGLSSVRDVKSAQEKGRMQYASDQKVASLGKKLRCLKCFKKEDDQRNDSYSRIDLDLPPMPTTATLGATFRFTLEPKLELKPEPKSGSTPIMEDKGIQTNATDGAVE